MNKLEIACVIIGFICMLCNLDMEIKGTHKTVVVANVFALIRSLIYLAMILIPMYFRFWR